MMQEVQCMRREAGGANDAIISRVYIYANLQHY